MSDNLGMGMFGGGCDCHDGCCLNCNSSDEIEGTEGADDPDPTVALPIEDMADVVALRLR